MKIRNFISNQLELTKTEWQKCSPAFFNRGKYIAEVNRIDFIKETQSFVVTFTSDNHCAYYFCLFNEFYFHKNSVVQ